MSNTEVVVSHSLQGLVPGPVVREDESTGRNLPLNVGRKGFGTAIGDDFGPIAASAALTNILDPQRGVPTGFCLDVTHPKLIHLKGTRGGEREGLVLQVIRVAPPKVVVVVGYALATEFQISGTDGDTHVFTEAADDEHLSVDVVVGVMEEGSPPNGASASALGVGALEDTTVFVL